MTPAIHWRSLTSLDLPSVEAIASLVHPRFPEDASIFAERQRLYPDGTRLLELDGKPSGYLLSHPWQARAMPALNARLGAIPADADSYYLHDLALLPAARGTGAAALVVSDILRHARQAGFRQASLVAVNDSLGFWRRQGFTILVVPHLAPTLAGYEAAAQFMVRPLA